MFFWSGFRSWWGSKTKKARTRARVQRAQPSLEPLEDRLVPSVSVQVVNANGIAEHRLIKDGFHLGTILQTPQNQVAFRPHPDRYDINGWGSTFYLAPFLGGGAPIAGIPTVTANNATDSFSIQVQGSVNRGPSTSYGTWSETLTFTYDAPTQTLRGTGALSVSLEGTLAAASADLNLGRIASNYLTQVPRRSADIGDTGDMKQVRVSYAAAGDPRDFTWSPPTQPAHFPTDTSAFVKIGVRGDVNTVDTQRLGYAPIALARKPTLVVSYQAQNAANTLSAGMTFDMGQGQNPFADNVGIEHLVLKTSTSSVNLTFDVGLEATTVGSGLYVWRGPAFHGTPVDLAEAGRIVTFAKREGISTIYYDNYGDGTCGTPGGIQFRTPACPTANDSQLAGILGYFHSQNLSVLALYTDATRLQDLLNYQSRVTVAQGFDGVRLNFEGPWPSGGNEPTTSQDIAWYANVVQQAGTLPVFVSISHHWDNPILFKSVTKPAYQHIIDLTAGVDIQTAQDQANVIVNIANEEVAYADAANKLWNITLETSNVVAYQPGMQPFNTFFDNGLAAMKTEQAKVLFAGVDHTYFAHHFYREAYGSNGPGWPFVITLQTLVAGDGQVFGLDPEGQLWRYRSNENAWRASAGNGVQIVVSNTGDGNAGNDLVFVRGVDSKIWYWNGTYWTFTGGYLPNLVAGDNQVFGVGFDGQVWQFHVHNGWRASRGYGVEIVVGSVGDGVSANDVVFLKGADSRIWTWTQSAWNFTGGRLKTIVAGDNQVFGVGWDNQVWRYRVSGPGAGWLASRGFGSEIVVGNTGDSNAGNDLIWLRVADNSMWLWTQFTWSNLNQKLKTIAAGDYQVFGLDEAGQLKRYLSGPSGGWRASGFIGDKLAVGSTMNDFAGDDIAFLLDAAGTLRTWRP